LSVNSKPLFILTGAVLLLSAPLFSAVADDTVSITLPPETAVYKQGTGQELATSRCMICHSADYVYMQPPLPKDKWVGVVNKMVKVFGCPIDEKDVDALAGYLAGQNGK
jgi:sulfite dehydrogenase